MEQKNQDFYQDMRRKINDYLVKEGSNYKFAKYLLAAPDLFHLLVKLTLDKEVPVAEKAKLGAALAYYISPIDIIPELIMGPVGYIDDVAVAAYVLNSVVNSADPELVKKHWAGEGDVLELVQSIIKKADEMVGNGLWKKIKAMF